MNEKLPPSPSGPMPPQGQDHADIDRAIDSLDQEGRASQERARKLIELGQAHEVMKQNIVKSAAIVSGRVQTSEDGEFLPVDSSLERSKAIAVQSILGGIGGALNLAWITYLGTEMPAELYAAVPVFVQLAAQGVATAYNNRKA